MSDSGFPDVSRIVSLIMENPALIEQISALAKQDGRQNEQKEVTPSESTPPTPQMETPVAAQSVRSVPSSTVSRTQLLTALKPYISKGRSDAIDSMISIGEILDMMRSR